MRVPQGWTHRRMAGTAAFRIPMIDLKVLIGRELVKSLRGTDGEIRR
jgi:hypothetical protein